MQLRIGGRDYVVDGVIDGLGAELGRPIDVGSLRRGADVISGSVTGSGVWSRRSDHRGLITVQRTRDHDEDEAAAFGDVGVEVIDEPADPVGIAWGALLPSVAAGLVMSLVFSPFMAILAVVSATVMIGRSLASRLIHRRKTRLRASQLVEYAAAYSLRLDEWGKLERQRRRALGLSPSTLLSQLASGELLPWSVRPDETVTMPVGAGGVSLSDPGPVELEDVPIPVELSEGRGLAVGGDRDPVLGLVRWLVTHTAATVGPADLSLIVLTTADRLVDWDWVKWLPGDPKIEVSQDEADRALGDSSNALVVVDGLEPVGPSELALLLSGRFGGPAAHQLVWIGDTEWAPAGCANAIRVWPDLRFDLTSVDGSSCRGIAYALAPEEALEAALILAPLDDPEVEASVSAVPESCVLGDLVGVDEDSPWAAVMAQAWPQGDRTSLRAQIGADRSGSVEVDLVADGPHALVAGTTGAGKSELLRTLIGALATAQAPTAVNFVLIDFKGGGAFDVVADLPHVAAVVTDLDASESARALRSLRAELVEREEVLRAESVTDIGELSSNVDLPRLVVVVDEFAALADELPDFLEGLVDVARRGRSLGVHLVLATQRPAGVVTGQIRANTALRICLRVQDAADSSDVVDCPDGARLPPIPGRAIMVRQGRRSELQIARVGSSDGGVCLRPFVAHPLLSESDEAEADSHIDTSGLIEGAKRIGGTYQAKPPWAELLAERPSWSEAEAELNRSVNETNSHPARIGLGWIDDPATRSHVALGWDRGVGGLMVVGSDLDRLARTVELAVVGHARHWPNAPIYVVDAVGSLGGLASLEAVGDVIVASEAERVERLIRLIQEPGPRLLVLHRYSTIVDQLTGVIGAEAPAVLSRLIRDGAADGLSVVVTAASERDLGSRTAGLFAQRIVHKLSDPAAYLMLDIRSSDSDGLGPNDVVEPGSGRRGRLGWLDPADLVSPELPSPERFPEPIRVLGAAVSRGELPDASRGPKGWIVPVGLDSELVPSSVLVSPGRPLVIVGQPGSGRTTALETAAAAFSGGEACLIDDADLMTKLDGEARLAEAAAANQPVVVTATPASLRGFGSWIAELLPTATVILLNPSRSDGEVVRAMVPDLTRHPVGRSVLIDRGRQSIIQVAG